MRRYFRRLWRTLMLVFVMLMMLGTLDCFAVGKANSGQDAGFSVHFIDVGQGDAALVECDGAYMLIDGGDPSQSNKMYSILQEKEINHLDIVVASHRHEDHIGGLSGALHYATADLVLCPVDEYDSEAFADFKRCAEGSGDGITIPQVGDEYPLGSALIRIVGVNGSEEANDTSIMLKIIYGSTSFLFTGDAQREVEQAVLAGEQDISATVLKVGHHGSDTSTTYPFLREVMPEYAVISAGTDNSYDHPMDQTLSRLQDAEVQVFRTDLQGDIVCVSDGNTVTFTVERLTDADGDSAAAKTLRTAATEAAEAAVDYILNTNTKKFHYPSCRSVKQMKEKNKREYTGTRDSVIGMGYDPCGNCHP